MSLSLLRWGLNQIGLLNKVGQSHRKSGETGLHKILYHQTNVVVLIAFDPINKNFKHIAQIDFIWIGFQEPAIVIAGDKVVVLQLFQ